MSALMNKLRETCQARWHNLSARDRRMLRWGVMILLPVLAVFGLALPLTDRLTRLEKQSRVQAAQLSELRALKATQPARAAAPPVSGGSALADRLRADLPPNVPGSVTAIDQGIDLQIEKAPLGALLEWLAQTQRREALFPVDVRLRADPATPGVTSGRIRLQLESVQ